MRILHYPDYERHKEEHDKLIAQLTDMQTKLGERQGRHQFRAGPFSQELADQAHHGRGQALYRAFSSARHPAGIVEKFLGEAVLAFAGREFLSEGLRRSTTPIKNRLRQ